MTSRIATHVLFWIELPLLCSDLPLLTTSTHPFARDGVGWFGPICEQPLPTDSATLAPPAPTPHIPSPFSTAQVLRSEWTAAGVYQSYDRHPQFELSVPKPTRVIIKMVASMCNDPAIVLLVCDNTHSPGQQLRGLIPEDKILAKSAYVRSDSISMEFKISQPKPSYLIVPCLQPPGSKGRVKLSVSSPTGDFQLTELLS